MEFRSSKPKHHHQIGRRPAPVIMRVICRKHPKHQQSPGVCSICLNERLSQLSKSSPSSRVTTRDDDASSCSSSSVSSVSSVSSSHYSASGSSSSTPVHHRHYRMSLFKSRSMAFVTRRRRADDGYEKKKSGFWSKLLRPRNRRIDGDLAHSRTMSERIPTTEVH